MQNSNTYKGYRYQKKCALLYLLNYYWKRGFSHITLEHPDGDDFDLHFLTKKEIYQTKDYRSVPSMKQFLIKMWRRYSENIKGSTEKSLSLLFIFSNDSTNKAFIALKTKNNTAPELDRIFNTITSDKKKTISVTKDEWQDFIRILSLVVIEEAELEKDLDDQISQICQPYDIDGSQKYFIYRNLLDRLDNAMANGGMVSRNEIQEQFGIWHSICFPHHKSYAGHIKKIILEKNTYTPPKKVPADETGEIS